MYSALAIGSHLRDVELGKCEISWGQLFHRSLQMLSDVLLARDSFAQTSSGFDPDDDAFERATPIGIVH